MYRRTVRRIILLCIAIAAAASLMIVPLIAQASSPPCDECPTETSPIDLKIEEGEVQALSDGDAEIMSAGSVYYGLSHAYKEGNTVRALAYTETSYVPMGFIEARVEVTLWKRGCDSGGLYWSQVAFAQASSTVGWVIHAEAVAVLTGEPSMLNGFYKTTSYHEVYFRGERVFAGELETSTVYLSFGSYYEDFEWGYDGKSLYPPGGTLDWYVPSQTGGSYAEIDDDYSHLGTQSARFYRDGDNNIYAYFSCSEPDRIRFYIMKYYWEDANIWIGNGEHQLRVKFTTLNRIQYCDDSGCHDTAGTITTPGQWTYPWHLIDLKNIDWAAGTYDIYFDTKVWGHTYYYCAKSGATMKHSEWYDGSLCFRSQEGEGSFLIDEILVD